jgi:hypothetical protein
VELVRQLNTPADISTAALKTGVASENQASVKTEGISIAKAIRWAKR